MKNLEALDRQRELPDGFPAEAPAQEAPKKPRWGGRLFGLAALITLAAGLSIGAWGHYTRERAVAATAQEIRDFVPNVRVATVQASDGTVSVSLPATTLAFATANLFARASGYIDQRNVDIGDRVKAGQLLAQITAPELDHQISQAQATLAQLKASLQQAQANMELARITWRRDEPLVQKGWVTPQQGTIDVQNLKAQEAAVAFAQANVVAQEAQLKVLDQQKAYQSVVAPFDGVITTRNVDVGTLVQADAVSSTFMFTIIQSSVIRTQVRVPQEQAFGLGPGVEAVVRVPEIPGRTFPGTVTRIADALEPGTRTLLIEIDVPNPDGALAAGIYCTVELHIPRKTPSLLVPADAVVFDRDGLHVIVIEDGVARVRKITVARDLGTQVEVRDGVRQGDQVILNPPINIAEGDKVRARPTAPAKRTS